MFKTEFTSSPDRASDEFEGDVRVPRVASVRLAFPSGMKLASARRTSPITAKDHQASDDDLSDLTGYMADPACAYCSLFQKGLHIGPLMDLLHYSTMFPLSN